MIIVIIIIIIAIDKDNKTALVIAIAVPLTHTLIRTEAEKIKKKNNLAVEIKNICKLNNLSIYSSAISAGGVVTKNFLKHLKNTDLTKNILRVGQKALIV